MSFTHFHCDIYHLTVFVCTLSGVETFSSRSCYNALLFQRVNFPFFFFFFCMLKKVGITPFATIIVTSVALSVDKVEHAQTNTTVECMLVKNSTSSMVVDIDYLWIGWRTPYHALNR